MDAAEQLGFIRCLSVRFSEHTEKEFLKCAMEVVGHVQKGIPFFFNDDAMVPALMSKGISEKDAYEYTQLGCIETVIPGMSNPHPVNGQTNTLKALEYVWNNGRSMMHPEFAPGLETGELSEFKTYDQFYKAVLTQIDHLLGIACERVDKSRSEVAVYAPRLYHSLLTEGCVESGKDYNADGAKYNFYQIMIGGIPNLADSLLVIQKYVYQEQRYTLQELKEILENDFPDESVRLEFQNKVPKFGNDLDEVDQIAADLIDHCCTCFWI